MNVKNDNKKTINRFSSNIIPNINYNDDDGNYTYEVGVVIDGNHYKGYVEVETEDWYIDYGDFTIGHRKIDNEEIEYWYELN